jgi:hypothetical protein
VIHGERVLIQGRVPATGTLLDAGELLVVVQLLSSSRKSAFMSTISKGNSDLRVLSIPLSA